MPQRYRFLHGILALSVFIAQNAFGASVTEKIDYSLAADKHIQSNESPWNPRAGLRLQGEVLEVEPNDACPGQAVACGDQFTQATLLPGDVDHISVDATQGDVLIVGTDSAGGFDPDTKVSILDGCGSTVATDDDGGPGLFSLATYVVPTTGSYTIRIEGVHPGVAGDYVAFVSCAPRDPGDLCGTAPALPCGSFSLTGTTVGATNDYDLTDGQQNDCTDFATAGSDVVFVIDQPSFTLTVTYTSSVDGSIYLVTDCNDPRGSCVAGADNTVEGEPETLTYTATTPGPYYLILDNFVGSMGPAGTYTLDGYLDCPPSRWVNIGGFANSGLGLGAAWGDYDGDGDNDVYLPKYGQANQLMENSGGVNLSSVADPLLSDPGNGRSATWVDYDNDGDLDLYLVNAQTANKLFHSYGTGGFSEITGSPINDPGDGRGAAWADYDNDGDVDLYLANAYGPNKLFQNDGAGNFVDATAAPLDDVGQGTGVAWADYDNDGDQDLYLANHAGANKLFQNDGAGGFVDVTAPPLDDAGHGRGVAWGDYDNDGDLDLYLTNSNSPNKLFRNDGGSFTDVTTGLLGDAGDGRGVVWADFDNDGDLDLYFANSFGPNRLLDNDGAGGFTDATPLILSDTNSGQGVAAADYDGDGDLEIYLVNAYTFDKIFRNDLPAGNHWLHIDLTGDSSNRSAVGARVRVVAGGVSQIREVTAGSGYLSQNSLSVEFGLGAATGADTVEICWPSGIKEYTTAVAANQRIAITEGPDPTDADEVALPKRLTLLGNVPDPFNPTTRIRYVLPGPSSVRITIYDARGRAVRHLFAGRQGPGLQSLVWNGTDDRGASVPSGSYVAHVSTAHGTETEKLTLLK